MSNPELTTEMREIKALIELELSRFVFNLELELSPQVKYALFSGGKRLRPMIALLSSTKRGGTRKKSYHLPSLLSWLITAA